MLSPPRERVTWRDALTQQCIYVYACAGVRCVSLSSPPVVWCTPRVLAWNSQNDADKNGGLYTQVFARRSFRSRPSMTLPGGQFQPFQPRRFSFFFLASNPPPPPPPCPSCSIPSALSSFGPPCLPALYHSFLPFPRLCDRSGSRRTSSRRTCRGTSPTSYRWTRSDWPKVSYVGF